MKTNWVVLSESNVAHPEQILNDFEIKLKRLIEELSNLRAERNQLSQELESLKAETLRQKNLIKDLEETNKKTKLAVAIAPETEDRSNLKNELNRYIKEIDRCIALLDN